ncbi:hypothetical protein [uncultured Roseobacter sp.]|nr:hypothetical protein [uncultured Roseobacter sp.]
MKNSETVLGVSAPSTRVTKTAAFLVAAALSVPVFAILSVVDWLWF